MPIDSSAWLHPFLLQRVLAYSSRSLFKLHKNSKINVAFNDTVINYGTPIIELLVEMSISKSFMEERLQSTLVMTGEDFGKAGIFDSFIPFVEITVEAASRIEYRRKNGLTYEGFDVKTAPKKKKPKRKGVSFGPLPVDDDGESPASNSVTQKTDTSNNNNTSASSAKSSAQPTNILLQVIGSSSGSSGNLLQLVARYGCLDLLKKLRAYDEAFFLKAIHFGKGSLKNDTMCTDVEDGWENSLLPHPPLFTAASNGHLHVVSYLVQECGVDPFQILENGKTLLHSFLMCGEEKDFVKTEYNSKNHSFRHRPKESNEVSRYVKFFFEDLQFLQSALSKQNHAAANALKYLSSVWSCDSQSEDYLQIEMNVHYSHHTERLTPLLVAVLLRRAGDLHYIINGVIKRLFVAQGLVQSMSAPMNLEYFPVLPELFFQLFLAAARRSDAASLEILFRAFEGSRNGWSWAFQPAAPVSRHSRKSNPHREFMIAVAGAHPLGVGDDHHCPRILACLKVLHQFRFPLDVGAQDSKSVQIAGRPFPSFMGKHGLKKGAVDVVRFWTSNTKNKMIDHDSTHHGLNSLFGSYYKYGDNDFGLDKEKSSSSPDKNVDIINFMMDELKVHPNGCREYSNPREGAHCALPLEAAIITCHCYGVKKLLSSGASFYTPNAGHFESAKLLAVIATGNPDMLEFCLSFLKKNPFKEKHIPSDFVNAPIKPNAEIVGVSRSFNESSITPLYYACYVAAYGRKDYDPQFEELSKMDKCVEILLKHGADVNKVNHLANVDISEHDEKKDDKQYAGTHPFQILLSGTGVGQNNEVILKIVEVFLRSGKMIPLENLVVAETRYNILHLLERVWNRRGKDEDGSASVGIKKITSLIVNYNAVSTRRMLEMKNKKNATPNIDWLK